MSDVALLKIFFCDVGVKEKNSSGVDNTIKHKNCKIAFSEDKS